jgi:hypothetical protein
MDKKLLEIIQNLRSEENRWDAILELKLYQDKSAIPFLSDQLKDPDWVVRWCVAEKLGDFRDPASLPDLVPLLTDEDLHVRRNAQKAISRFKVRAVPYVLPYLQHGDPQVRASVHKIILELKELAIPAIEKLIFNQGLIISSRLVHILWQIGGPLSERALMHLLDIPVLQKPIILILGSMKSSQSLPRFLNLYGNPKLKKPIFVSFKRLGDDIFFEFIIRSFLRSSDPLSKRAEEIILKIGKFIVPQLVKASVIDPGSLARVLYLLERIGPQFSISALRSLKHPNPEAAKHIKLFIKKYAHTIVREAPAQQKTKRFFGLFD